MGADFGLARLPADTGAFRTMSGALTGTPLFMAPEQIEHPDVDTPSIDGYAFGVLAYRLLLGAWPYPAGTVAMANAGPNTNGSQFFLVTQDSQLPPSYTPFGKISSGMEKLMAVANGGTKDGASDGAPAADMVIDSVAVKS